MSVSGLFLVLFLLFHMSMNLAAVFSTEAYNAICEFLGANWYALAGTLILAAGVVVHLVYATVLTLHNRSSRGSQRYACLLYTSSALAGRAAIPSGGTSATLLSGPNSSAPFGILVSSGGPGRGERLSRMNGYGVSIGSVGR